MKSTEELVAALERAPAIVVPLVRQANPAILKRRPAPGEWSIHENACHLAEVHPLFFRRLDLMLSETNPAIKSYDPGRDDPDDALLKITSSRGKGIRRLVYDVFLRYFQGTTPDLDWEDGVRQITG